LFPHREKEVVMDSQKPVPQDSVLTCEVCLEEIPESGSYSDETSDYVRHFCGLECYRLWREKAESREED
jgi:hypothetical protein